MAKTMPIARPLAAPRTTAILAIILGVGILMQASFAGAFIGGHHRWLTWHAHLGDLLLLVPLANLLVGLAFLRRARESGSILIIRATLLALLILMSATGHRGGTLLAVHIPTAIATVALLVHHMTTAVRAAARPTG